MLLIDDLLDRPVSVADFRSNIIRVFVRNAAVFDITPAAAHFYEEDGREFWHDQDFPCLTPPFAKCWMEFVAPSRLLGQSGIGARPGRLAGARIAAMVRSEENCDRLTLSALMEAKVNRPATCADPDAPDLSHIVPRWTLSLSVVSAYGPDVSLAPWSYCLPLDQDGSPLGCAFLLPDPDYPKPFDMNAASEIRMPFLFALSLLNCVNVRPQIVAPPRQVRRAREREGKRPLLTYSVVSVPGRGGASSAPHEGDRSTRLHMVRGHFKRRATGTFYWHPYVRGDSGDGVNLSTYRVRPRGPRKAS